MNCSLGNVIETAKEKPLVMAEVAGRKIPAVVDTSCTQTLVQAELMPGDQSPTVKMVCTRGKAMTYAQEKVLVQVQGVAREIPIRMAPDLPHSVMVGTDWPEVYDV